MCALLAGIALARAAHAEPELPDRLGDAEIAWDTDVARVLHESPGRSHPILIEVGAVWCGPCRLMHKTTFRDPEIVGAASSYATASIDVDHQQALARRFGVHHLPTLLFLDGNGEEIVRIAGYVAADKLHRVMRIIARLLEASRSNEQIRQELQSAVTL
jgi:thiol:disulfide interchange protein